MEERATLANIDTTGCVLGGRKAIEVPAMEIITAGVRSGVVKRSISLAMSIYAWKNSSLHSGALQEPLYKEK